MRATVRLLSALHLLGLAGLLGACSSSKPAPPFDDGFDRNALLASVGERVVLPTYRELLLEAQALRQRCLDWETAVTSGGTAANELALAQGGWRAAMEVWQRAEAYQLGPAGSPDVMTGGANLRDALYSWPTVNPCSVDQKLATEEYAAPGFFAGALVNAYGLAALEYLLFHQGPDNACPPQSAPNSGGQWAALSPSELTRRRSAYARAAAGFLEEKAAELVSAWEPDSGAFVVRLREAGKEGSPFPSAQAALDELFAALFYLDFKVKDDKLATPAGISPDCLDATCPSAVETRFADFSTRTIHQNLAGFRDAFLGAPVGEEGIGFDDLLLHREAGDLSTQMLADVEAAQGAVEALGPSMKTALATNLPAVEAAHAAVKRVTDALKTQLVTTLNLRVPAEGAADND